MPSGYEKSKDYGDPDPLGWGTVVGVLGFVAVIAWLFWRTG